MKKLLQALKRDERGVSAVEYAILAGVIVVIVVAGVTAFGDNIADLFGASNTAIDGALSGLSDAKETAGGGQ